VGSHHAKDPDLQSSDEENDQQVAAPLLDLTRGCNTSSKGSVGDSGEDRIETPAESDEMELGGFSCIC
jgi:hypothetical protein